MPRRSERTGARTMAAINAAARAGAEDITCTVTIGMRGFMGCETHGPYPEKNLVLRVWHPAFMDFKYIRYDQLATAAHNGAMTTFEPLVFTQLRRLKYDATHHRVRLHNDAVLGLQLFAQTENDTGQDCAKPQGACWRVLLRDVHLEETSVRHPTSSYMNVTFVAECMEGNNVPGVPGAFSDGIKAKIVELTVYARINVAVQFVASPVGSLAVDRFSDRARGLLRSFVSELRDTHEDVRIACEKLRKYYSLQYKIASGIALPASAYMLHMMGAESVPPSAKLVRALFSAAISGHPEFASVAAGRSGMTAADVWVARCEDYLGTANPKPAPDPRTDITFMDCLRVAMHVLTAYPNAVPYLLDMEIDVIGRAKGNPRMYAQAMSAMQSTGDAGGTYDEKLAVAEPVERFACAVMETYGTDCEDFAMYAYWLKNMIQRTFAASGDAVLRTLARIYELFVACVTHMFCKGDDGQGVMDDGVYHFATYMLPRVYMRECWKRAQPAVDAFAARVEGARAWEADYRTHLGVFIIEGTNTVDSAQFRQDPYTEKMRETNTQCACAGIRGITHPESQRRINVFHSYVYAKSGQLSGFYRWALAMFCGESSLENVLDMAFFAGGRKGVRVEDLADMKDTVSVHQVARYEKAVLELCRELIDIYRPPYRGLVSTECTTEPGLVACILGLAPKLNKLIGPPPSDLAQCRRHVRVHMQHLDFSHQRATRASELARALEEYADHVRAKSVSVHANILGATWVTACNLRETANDHLHTVVQLFVVFYY